MFGENEEKSLNYSMAACGTKNFHILMQIFSVILYFFLCRGSMKTDAPNDFIWDMIKSYEKDVNKQLDRDESKRNLNDINKPIYEFIGKYCEKDKPVDFTHHPDAEPESKSKNLLRFQENLKVIMNGRIMTKPDRCSRLALPL